MIQRRTSRYPDEFYNNQAACHLAGMLAVARLLKMATMTSMPFTNGSILFGKWRD